MEQVGAIRDRSAGCGMTGAEFNGQIGEEIHRLMSVPPETGSSFTALLELPANQAMELLVHSPDAAVAENPTVTVSGEQFGPGPPPPPPPPPAAPPIFPSDTAFVDQASKFSSIANSDEILTAKLETVKQEPLDSDSNRNSNSSPAVSNPAVDQNPKPAKRNDRERKGKESNKKSKKAANETAEDGGEKLPYVHVRARRGQATDSHSLAERARREKINARMKLLQELVPGCNKISGTAMVLDEIINHVQSLQRQVEFLSMRLATVNPRVDFNFDTLLAAEGGSPMEMNFPGTIMPSMWPEEQVHGNRQQYQQLWNLDGLHQPVWGREEDNSKFITPENSLLSYDSSANSDVCVLQGYGTSLQGSSLQGVDRGAEHFTPTYQVDKFNWSNFPPGFLFGASSSAYQIEGAFNTDGRGPSIWDNFTHQFPEKIRDRSNGDVATDSYHLYKEDIKLLKEMNMNSYRFSISWPRVLPRGKLSRGINEIGVQYYNNLINHLLANGITPIVTLFHWDLPQALEDDYGGFLSPQIVNDFHDYVNVCFESFGDQVKHWITFNEPRAYSLLGYDMGMFPPGRCSSWMNNNCTGGNSSTEPYLVSHHQLLAHAAATKLYKTKYQAHQKGIIGITLDSNWMVPYSHSVDDRRAATRALDFTLGSFMDPLVYGDYPSSMRTLVGDRLPRFTKEQSDLVKGSYDFIGINYYTSYYVIDASQPIENGNKSFSRDLEVRITASRNGKLIGDQSGSFWIYDYPRGLWKLLLYIKKKYQNPVIYITENGVGEVNNSTMQEALNDKFRIKYHHGHLRFLHNAIRDGAKVKGYYGWAIMDNFEWINGFTLRFGLNYVDFNNGLKRYPKLSAKWFQRFLQK